VADSKQFGNPKVLQFGDKTGGNRSGDGHCAQCEAMLADAIDGTLSAADQELFDTHVAECGPCRQMLADARRGAAFLEMLRAPAPEPPAALLERILAETSGVGQMVPVPMHHVGFPVPAQQPGHIGVAALAPELAIAGAAHGNLLPFPRRFTATVRSSSLGQILLQPRLAMTAAMAFFSITLTMNLTGVHLQDLRASDLRPSSLERDFTNAKVSVVQHYNGLRVVYELESRVHDLENSQDSEALPPAPPPVSSSAPAKSNQAPAAQPAPSQQKAAPKPDSSQPGNDQPGGGQPARKQFAPDPYFSRREDLRQSRRLLVAEESDGPLGYAEPARVERKLA
jgi:hypothetical protein